MKRISRAFKLLLTPLKLSPNKDDKKEKKLKKEKELFDTKFEDDPKVTEEQRQKTIDLMIKMLGSHIKEAKEEAKELSKFTKQTEGKIKNFEKELEREEVQVVIDDIKRRRDLANKELNEAMYEADKLLEMREPQLEDVLVDNEILLAEVENYVKRKVDSDEDSF